VVDGGRAGGLGCVVRLVTGTIWRVGVVVSILIVTVAAVVVASGIVGSHVTCASDALIHLISPAVEGAFPLLGWIRWLWDEWSNRTTRVIVAVEDLHIQIL